MIRDMNLIRQILLQIEANDDPQLWIDPEIDGRPEQGISYHIMIMEQAGLLDAIDRSAIGIFRWSARRLTWLGHEFLDVAKDESRWKSCLAVAGGNGAANFDILHQSLRDAGLRALES